MSFLLKSPRLVTNLVGFARHAKFAFRKRKVFLRTSQRLDKVNQTFARSYTLAPQNSDSQKAGKGTKETFYQKSISQIFFDVKTKGYTSKEDFDNAWRTLKSSTPFTVEQTALLIRSCGHNLPLETTSYKLKLVKEVWDSFDDIGVKKSIDHYNALLDVYIELEHDFSPEDFLNNLKNKSLFPNLKTYKKLLHAFSIQGNTEKFQSILEHMKMNFVHLDDGIFNTLILGYSLKGDFISARGILELMKEKKLALSSESYVNLALGYAKLGEIDKVKEIIDECKKEMMVSTREYLEIAYTFAVNRHSEHFSIILDMIKVKKNFLLLSTKIIHRLLHQNLDKEAFMVFELRDKLESISLVHESTKMFLDHYVRFREPNEVVEITKTFCEKGWSAIALAYCIKEILIRKDVSDCLNFVHILKIQGYSVRIHYFYPILVKSRRQFGNEEVLKIIRHTKKYKVSFGREAAKALNEFYDFFPGAEFDDLKKLTDAGIKKNLVAWKILDIFLHRGNIDSAAKLVSTYGIAYPAILLPVSLASAFSKPDSDHGKYFHIFYHLIHNIRANKIKKRLNLEVDPIEYEQFIMEMAKVCDKEFVLRIIQEMLKKKVPLTPYAASFISKEFPCPEITDIVFKLSSPDFKLEFDENIVKQLVELEEPEQNQKIFGKIEEKNGWARLYRALERQEKVPDVLKIFEDLAGKPELRKDGNHRNIVERLLSYVSLKGDVASTERVYGIGVRKGLIKAENYGPCLTALLVRGNVGDAVKRYYEGLKATRESSGLESLIKNIKRRNYLLALNDLNAAISKIYDESFAATYLLVIFSKLDCSEEIKTILKSKTDISKVVLGGLCQTPFKERNVKFFEKLEKALRNTVKLNLAFFYRRLLKLYEIEGNSEKIVELYATLNRENAMKKNIRKVFVKFLNNLNGNFYKDLKNASQLSLEDGEEVKPLKKTETVSYKESIQDVCTEDVRPSFRRKDVSSKHD